MKATIEHGTYAGYQAHRRRDSVPCQPCRDACADYMRGIRAGNVWLANREREQRHAYTRALARLREAHQDEFATYYAEERKP